MSNGRMILAKAGVDGVGGDRLTVQAHEAGSRALVALRIHGAGQRDRLFEMSPRQARVAMRALAEAICAAEGAPGRDRIPAPDAAGREPDGAAMHDAQERRANRSE